MFNGDERVHIKPPTRRDMMTRLGACAAALGCQPLRGQMRVPRLVKTFPKASLLDIAPDANSLCLRLAPAPFAMFSTSPLRRPSNGNANTIAVVDIDSWKVRFEKHLSSFVHAATFLADSNRILMNLGPRAGTFVTDIRDGQEIQLPSEPRRYFLNALKDAVTLEGVTSGDAIRTHSVALMQLPELREVKRIEFTSDRMRPNYSGLWCSADRQTLAYSVGPTVFYLRSHDLSLVWESNVEAGMLAHKLVVSARGEWVAAAFSDEASIMFQKKFYVAILKGSDGSLHSKVNVDGEAGIALSPDGRVLAVSFRPRTDSWQYTVVPKVQLFDLATGAPFATLAHAPVPARNASISQPLVQFTPDGRYLVTSGYETRVWRMEGM